MAEIVYGGNAAVKALLYGDTHPGTRQFFESQRGTAFSALTESARQFAQSAIERFGFMASERTQRLIRDVRRQVNWIWHGDYIRPLRSIDDLQMAAPIMIRYMMAEPMTRRMYQQQQLAGYDEHYVDVQPGKLDDQVVEYRQVMQDIVVVDEDEAGNPTGYHADMWMDDVLPDSDENQLSFEDQLAILESWAHMRQAIKNRSKDPTSTYGASLD